MMRLSFEVNYEQVDALVVSALMDSYDAEYAEDGLRNAIITVLEYYMTPSKYEDWIASVAADRGM